ncbi:hypothetical protein RBIBE_21530 [Bacillus velezensis]|nr:ATP-dependent DNA helicase RecQ [Bacillus velezensis]GLZ63028.1 hypothetical protein Bamy02_00810 [Bacillus amyloliquefaciens]BCT28540.1 hypothetical protein BVAD3_22140 [Bacillus velezensis]BCU86775.1 hypothetical protein KOF112_20400 [Bacillus velezensis]BET18163.1 hypothetical protein RBIBE_21530 [Bacillus velezensis]
MSGAAAPQAPHAIHVSLSTIVYFAMNKTSQIVRVGTNGLPYIFLNITPIPLTYCNDVSVKFQQKND